MNAAQLFQDIETGCLVEVTRAANSYYSEVRGLTVRQQFYIYPDDAIVALDYVDGGYQLHTLLGDNEVIFRNRYPELFRAN